MSTRPARLVDPRLSLSSPIPIMKAARYYGPGDIRIEQIPEPQASEGQVKIKVAWNGICGSDVHAFHTNVIKFPTLDTPQYVTRETLPITLGHEFSGTIVDIGDDVDTTKFAVGQNVCVEPLLSCMEKDRCTACASGTRNICPHFTFIGIGGWGGGLSEYITVDQESVHILPEGVPLELGACVEPLSVGWHAVRRSGFKAGDSTLVLGAGPIGLFIVKILRALGASWIGVSEPSNARRVLSLQHGASDAYDPTQVDVAALAMGACPATLGVDVAFDCAGVQVAVDMAMRALRPRGTLMNVALWSKKVEVDMNLMVGKELVYTAAASYNRVHPEVIEALASGKLGTFDDLITAKIAVEDVVEKGIRALEDRNGVHVKILVHP